MILLYVIGLCRIDKSPVILQTLSWAIRDGGRFMRGTYFYPTVRHVIYTFVPIPETNTTAHLEHAVARSPQGNTHGRYDQSRWMLRFMVLAGAIEVTLSSAAVVACSDSSNS